jgi:Zn-dependent oligopeptidase
MYEGSTMERHLSTGVSIIVALMAAHRAASETEGPATAYNQDEVARIDAYLHEDELAEPAAVKLRRNQSPT